MARTEPSSAGSIQVLQRAALLIRTIGEHRGGLRLAELGELVDLPKTTIHRIVGALTEERLLRIDPSGRIWLGSSVLALAPRSLPGEAAASRIVSTNRSRAAHRRVSGAALGGVGRGDDGRVVFFTAASRRTSPGKAWANSKRI